MSTFQIEFDTRRRDWVLKAHPLINHADLRFGNDSTPGFLGLIRAKVSAHPPAGGRGELGVGHRL